MKTFFSLLALLSIAAPLRAADDGQIPADRNLAPEKAAALLADKPGAVTVLDVRTADEHAKGHIAGARNIDFYGDDFEAQLKKLDRNKPYLMHCRSGSRSSKTYAQMKALGFTNLYHLDGGFSAWQAAGQKVQK